MLLHTRIAGRYAGSKLAYSLYLHAEWCIAYPPPSLRDAHRRRGNPDVRMPSAMTGVEIVEICSPTNPATVIGSYAAASPMWPPPSLGIPTFYALFF